MAQTRAKIDERTREVLRLLDEKKSVAEIADKMEMNPDAVRIIQQVWRVMPVAPAKEEGMSPKEKRKLMDAEMDTLEAALELMRGRVYVDCPKCKEDHEVLLDVYNEKAIRHIEQRMTDIRSAIFATFHEGSR